MSEYFDKDFWERVSEETALYTVHTRNHRSASTSKFDLIRLRGNHILTGTLKYPQAKIYWQNRFVSLIDCRNNVKRSISWNKNILDFVDNFLNPSADG